MCAQKTRTLSNAAMRSPFQADLTNHSKDATLKVTTIDLAHTKYTKTAVITPSYTMKTPAFMTIVTTTICMKQTAQTTPVILIAQTTTPIQAPALAPAPVPAPAQIARQVQTFERFAQDLGYADEGAN